MHNPAPFVNNNNEPYQLTLCQNIFCAKFAIRHKLLKCLGNKDYYY